MVDTQIHTKTIQKRHSKAWKKLLSIVALATLVLALIIAYRADVALANEPAEAPRITASISGNTITASVSNTDIDNDTWRNGVHNTRVDCNTNQPNPYTGTGSTVTLTANQRQTTQYICFYVESLDQTFYGYLLVEVPPGPADTTPPVVTTSISGNTVTASSTATDLDSSTWKHFVATTNPNCGTSADSLYTGSGRTVTLTADQRQATQYVCFKVQDTSNNAGYTKRVVGAISTPDPNPSPNPSPAPEDTTPPSITISVNGNQVTANTTASDVDNDSWKHFVATTNPNCGTSADSLYTGSGRTVTLTADQRKTTQYVCFKVQDTSNNAGYGKRVVAATSTPDTTTPTPSPRDTTPPTILISLNNNTATARSFAADLNSRSWRYYVTTTNPNCKSANSRYIGVGRVAALSTRQRQTRQYICFRAADRTGNVGYAKLIVQALSSPGTDSNAPQARPGTITPDNANSPESEGQDPSEDTPPETNQPKIQIDYVLDEDGSLKLEARVPDTATEIDSSSWRVIRGLTQSSSCNQAAFEDESAETPVDQTIKLQDGDYGRYLCLAVSSVDQQTAIRSIYIDEMEQSTEVQPTNANNDESNQAEDKTDESRSFGLLNWLGIGLAVVLLAVAVVVIAKKRSQ